MGKYICFLLFLGLFIATVKAQKQKHYLNWEFLAVDSEEHGQAKGSKGTNCTCGTTNKVVGKIVGGRVTTENEYPHMVAMVKSRGGGFSQFCGGTILTQHHIITAAHCTVDLERSERLAIVVGAHSMTSVSKNTKLYDVMSHIEHERYDSDTYANDIALLIVYQKITFNEAVGPACLPTEPMNEKLVGEYVKITGWGDTSFEGMSSNVLLKVNLRVIPLLQCSAQYRSYSINLKNPTQICTYSPDKDACQGDSGGPVTWLDPKTNRYTLIGLVSFGIDCATEKPGVNTDVFAYTEWIQHNIAETTRDTSSRQVKTCAKLG